MSQVTTYALLSSRTCTVPAASGLWTLPGLTFDPGGEDRRTCWHGEGYRDCNRDIHIVYR